MSNEKRFHIPKTKIKDIYNNSELDINDDILEQYKEKLIHDQTTNLDKCCLVKYIENCGNNINIFEIIGSKENAKRLLKEYKYIQNLIEKEYFSRF